jgi:ABC-type Fe3+/spermidine/putrescine transport system ATPase subunit
LKHIQQQVGITVLYVTHDQEEALTLSDRIAVMKDGKVEQIGSAHDLYERPVTRFVADFVGETNLLKVTVESSGNNLMVVSSPCVRQIPVPPGLGFKTGESVYLSIRPEKIYFLDEVGNLECRVSGVVEEVIYMGDVTKYYVRLGEQELLTVKQHNREGIRQRSRGEQVAMGWSPLNSCVLKP